MAAEQLSGDDQDLQALQQQAVMESFVEQDMERWHLAEGQDGVPLGTFARMAQIILSRRHGSSHNYHAGGRGVARPDYHRGADGE